MKKLLITISYFYVYSLLYGQAPGYMGKTFLFQYEIGGSPAIINTTSTLNDSRSWLSISDFDDKINSYKKMNLEYVVNKTWAFGVIYQNYSTGKVFTEYMDFREYTDIYNPEQSYLRSESIDIGTTIKCNAFGLSATSYYKNIAPLGNFIKFEFLYIPYKVNMTYAISDNSGFSPDVIFQDDQYHTYSIGIELGKQKVFFNRIIAKYAIRSALVFDMYPSGSDFHLNTSNVLYYNANQRLFMFNAFSAHVGIGLLIF